MKHTLIYVAVGAAILVSIVALGVGLAKPESNLNMQSIVDEVVYRVQNFGAAPGPDRFSQCETTNGVQHCWGSSSLRQASTTLCSIKSPAATSTLVFGSVALITGTSSATAMEIGKSTVMDATTTRLTYDSAIAGTQTLTTAVASTSQVGSLGETYTTDAQSLVFAPNTWFNVKYGGSVCGATNSAACNSFVGSCKAEFVVN